MVPPQAAGSSAPQACPLVEASPGDRRFGNYIDTASLPRVTEREKRWQNRIASRQRGTQSEGPAGPLMWVTGSLVARLTRCGRSIVIQRDRRRGSVETMISSTSSRLASLRIASTRSGINDLAVSLRAGLAKPGQLLLQPPLGQGPGDLVGAWDPPPHRARRWPTDRRPRSGSQELPDRSGQGPAFMDSAIFETSCSPPRVWLATMR